jgi:hypothetical protein
MPRRHTKKRKTRRQRKMRGGFYSFAGAVGPGAANYTRGSEMGQFAVDKGGNIGNLNPQNVIQYGRGRRKSRGRKTRRMRGGGKYGGVSASFQGSGSRGMADYAGINTRGPELGEAANGAFNDKGAHSLSQAGSFNILPK